MTAVRARVRYALGMPKIDLDATDLALLNMMLKWRLGGLAMELDHTDSRDYREALRKQREQLERLQEKLGAAARPQEG